MKSEGIKQRSTQMLKKKIGISGNQPLADFPPAISIVAKELAAEMTRLNGQSKNLQGHTPIEREHLDNSGALRKMLLERGIVPESLPPAEAVITVQGK